jgi:serine/threonine protein phosphatase PrpC
MTQSGELTSRHDDARRPRADEIDMHGLTHTGRVRAANEDHFLVGSIDTRLHVHLTSLPGAATSPLPLDRRAFLAMVADGVGGGVNGEEASRLTVETFARGVTERMLALVPPLADDESSIVRALEDVAQQCHADIVQRGRSARSNGMATTLTLWLGVWPNAYLLQAGDSRYYRYRDGVLSQLSRDQTVAQDLIDQGVLTPRLAARTRWANVLSSAIGGHHSAPLMTPLQNDWTSVHLLCSDGLTKHVSDTRIRDRLASMTSARQACEALLADALEAGGTDNITIVLGRAVPAAEHG